MTNEELQRCYIIGDTHLGNPELLNTWGFRNSFDAVNTLYHAFELLPDDTILIHVGDMIEDNFETDVFKKFKKVILIKGNHDLNYETGQLTRLGVTDFHGNSLYFNDLDLIISHEPIRLPDDSTIRNIHGHIHEHPNKYGKAHPEKYYNVSANVLNFKPVKLTDVLDKLQVDYKSKQFLQTCQVDTEFFNK